MIFGLNFCFRCVKLQIQHILKKFKIKYNIWCFSVTDGKVDLTTWSREYISRPSGQYRHSNLCGTAFFKYNSMKGRIYMKQWNGFVPGKWQEEINVRDFIQNNYTPYDGTEDFLCAPTERTVKVREKMSYNQNKYY